MKQATGSAAVLVVEDDPDTREVLASLFRDAGYTIFTEPDGMAALTFLRACPTPLVVVLDWRLPGLNGVAVLHAMATDAPEAQRRIYILLTAMHEAAIPVLAALPADLSVTLVGKPFDLDHLLALVARAASQLQQPQRDEPAHAG